MPCTVPVLFLVFNRIKATKLVFEQIKKSKPSELYIASDGPRSLHEKEVVYEIRNWIIENIDWECNIKTLFRDNNLGCGKSVSNAITWFFDNVEMGIILEDDCLPNDSFFSFCSDLLIKYQYDSRIMHVSGTNLNTIECSNYNSNSYFFSKYVNIWGWATWKRAWDKYDFDIKGFENFRKKNSLSQVLSYLPAYVNRLKWYSEVMNISIRKKGLDTWDYQWCFTCISNSGLSIVPEKNLIKNIGFDELATHTKEFNILFSKESESIFFPLSHPDRILIDKEKDLQYEKRQFGSIYSTIKIIFIDYVRKIILKRDVDYLTFLRIF